MREDGPLIGRERELAEIERALFHLQEGHGGLTLLAGEAGVGKTRLAEDCLRRSSCAVFSGAADPEARLPYAPITAALRTYLQSHPAGFRDCGSALAILLPELAPVPAGGDSTTVLEAIRCGFEVMGRQIPAVVFLDDLQWADSATLDVLAALAGSLEALPVLVLGLYRNNEIPRGHPLRRMRASLRRAVRLHEITLEPLDREDTKRLAGVLLGGLVSPILGAVLFDRTDGLPFFVKEFCAALMAGGRLQPGPAGLELVDSAGVTVPESVRDAVLVRLDMLVDPARTAIEAAAVAGLAFDLDLVEAVTGGGDLQQAIDRGLVVEASGRGRFRHALVREALYSMIPWSRRRLLHRRISEYLESRRAPSLMIAEHWVSARDATKARQALLAAAEEFSVVHAYRDAAQACRRALELWPEGEEEGNRLDALDHLAHCLELSGDLAEATPIRQAIVEGRKSAGDVLELARSWRRLAVTYELQGSWEKALAARQSAADLFATAGQGGEAAADRLAVAGHLHAAGRFSAALDLIGPARAGAEESNRSDLRARALALEGAVRAKLGQIDAGVETARAGLLLALDSHEVGAAAEAYQRLASVMEQAADYRAARQAYEAAVNFCQAHGVVGMGHFCLACLGVVLRQTGEWDQAVKLCSEVLASSQSPPHARAVAADVAGLISSWRGDARRARGLLAEALGQARRFEMAALEIEITWGLAVSALVEGHPASAADHARVFLERWRRTEDLHYGVAPLRWGATLFADLGMRAETYACADALARITAATTNREALAALAHALGEIALLEGSAERAALQFAQALEHLRALDVPYECAQTQLRAAAALRATSHRDEAVRHTAEAYHTARRLGAKPLAAVAARELAAMGERVERRSGRRLRELTGPRLSQREVGVLRLVTLGRTNREIAREMFLSPRTVDMHIRHILDKLDCRSRAEAAARAVELGLVTTGSE